MLYVQYEPILLLIYKVQALAYLINKSVLISEHDYLNN